jgi:ribonuclease III
VEAESKGALARLESLIGHAFARRELLQLALTHRSFSESNNERLEFLGDALLDLCVSEELFRRFPALREGELSRLRASLVRGETLAEIGRDLVIGDHVLMGAGEAASGGRTRSSILADVMEALIAAVYLDAGFDAAMGLVRGWYRDRFDGLNPGVSHKDAKTELQEFLQARRAPLPRYEVVAVSGEAHQQQFRIQCHASGLSAPAPGFGPSKRIAEQVAAREALKRLRDAGEQT